GRRGGPGGRSRDGRERRGPARGVAAGQHVRGAGPGPLSRGRRRDVRGRRGGGYSPETNVRLTEFMQYRSPVGVWGASSNTWPRCDPQRAQRTSVRII